MSPVWVKDIPAILTASITREELTALSAMELSAVSTSNSTILEAEKFLGYGEE
jgi:hypothetical protein